MSEKKGSVHCCSVVGCLKQHQTIHRLPSNEEQRAEWISFIFDANIPAKLPKMLFVCSSHFEVNSYTNFGQYNAGLSSKLHLKDGAVPTIRNGFPRDSGKFNHTGTQTDAPSLRKCGTQLSIGTLKAHVISTRTQTPALSQNTVGTQTTAKFPEYMLSSTHSTEPEFRPLKRPRVESGFISPESQVVQSDSAVNPGKSLTRDSTMSTDSRAADNDKKYIVFESCLRELFDTCPVCKSQCEVQQQEKGTYVAFHQICKSCQYSRQWQSQPLIQDTPAGDVQLSAATYFSGASFIELEKLCKALQLQICQYDTYRKHARKYLEPAIVHKWNSDQQNLFSELKQGGKVGLAGDMRADSPGDSAKFGSYSVMHLESNKVLDLQLIQCNEVGDSYHMEKEALKRSLDLLHSNGLAVDYMVTDGNPQIRKFLNELNITQFYDVCHLERGLSKKLPKLAKNKDCEMLKKWQCAIKAHVYYRSVALHKFEKILTNKSVLKDVERLSHHHQTPSLESFDSLVLRFAPKKVVFPFIGMLCRLYLATMHHNENTSRKQATTASGKPVYKVLYPKSKKGEATTKPVKTDPTFNYVADLMRLVCEEVMEDPDSFAEGMKKIPVPETLST